MLSELGANMSDRLKPAITNTQIITSVEPYQAQLLNTRRKGSLLVPGQTLGILECAPAGYICIATNEAELFPWLVHLYEVWRELTPEAVYWGTVVGLGEPA